MRMQIFIPQDTTALALGADKVSSLVAKGAESRGLHADIIRNGSRGMFWLEPLVEVQTKSGRIAFGPVNTSDVDSVLDALQASLDGKVLIDHALYLGEVKQIEYLAKQQRLTFKRSGVADPACITSYQRLEGFVGLTKALSMTGQDIVDELKNSGLRGRGGAAFPAGIKWQTVLDTAGEQKYIVCNADEGDSGTYSDRMLMEGDPFCLIEGMIIAGLAVNATKGYIYLRDEYPLAYKVLDSALNIARLENYLGDNIQNSGKKFDIEIRLGAGAYICGEETSMLESLEGKRGEVRPCLLYTSPSPRDGLLSRMPSSA